jgi:hypothetical protein
MTQPSFVPIAEADQVRPALRLEVPRGWSADRPADLRSPGQPSGRRLGTPGPDQGFALRLARRVEPTFVLDVGEHAEDVTLGVALVAARRAALFGRAPSIYDVRAAVTLFGLDVDAPAALRTARAAAFAGLAHDYARQRALVDTVPEDTLQLSPDELEGRMPADWGVLSGLASGPAH